MPDTESSSEQTTSISSRILINLVSRQQELELESVDLAADDILFEQGDVADSMYLLISGRLGVRVTQADGSAQQINEMEAGELAGELALISGQKRSATIYAIEAANLLRITRHAVKALLDDGYDLISDISVLAAGRWHQLYLANCLHSLFGTLDEETLHTLQADVEWYHLSNGESLYSQGDTADGLFIVVQGRLRSSITTADGDEKILAEIGTAETFGESALFSNEPRYENIYAIRNTSVARISTSLFDELVKRHPKIMRKIAGTVVDRHQQTIQPGSKRSPEHMTVALLPVSPTVDIKAFADRLRASLTPHGSTLVLDKEGFDEEFGLPGVSQQPMHTPIQPVIIAELDKLEGSSRYLLYVADDMDSTWSERIVNQADRVLMVADARHDCSPALETGLLDRFSIPVRSDLVMLHPADTEVPTGTDRWLDAYEFKTHYHVRHGDQSHYDRLARRLSGNAIALVLGGGAARGYTQMGVYRAIMELDIPIDYICGASMGAIIAGGISAHGTYDKFEELAEWTAKKGVTDYTLPFVALTASAHVTEICQHNYGDRMIEDLWLPFFCVSTNITKSELELHTRGLMWRAVRASMSIPSVFLPVMEDGDVLVDGGIMNNFPAELMHEIAETRRIIGINVFPHRERKRDYDFDTSLSGWKVLWHMILPFRKKLRTPSIAEVIMRSMEVNGKQHSKNQSAFTELTIVPDSRGFKLKDYDKWRELAQCGYEQSFELLKEWKSKQYDLID